MGTENHRVEKYQYEVQQDISDGATRELTFLSLFDKQRNLLCAFVFMPNGNTLAKPVETPDGHVAIQMHESDFSRIIDMLRNEKPVYFSWWREAESFRLCTSKEPVGEQELRKLFSILYV